MGRFQAWSMEVAFLAFVNDEKAAGLKNFGVV